MEQDHRPVCRRRISPSGTALTSISRPSPVRATSGLIRGAAPHADCFHDKTIDRCVPDHLEKRFARLGFLQSERAAKFAIHHANPAPIVHHDQTIEHRAEDRLHTEFALAKAFFELTLAIDQHLEREPDAPRLRIGADQEFSRRALVDNGLAITPPHLSTGQSTVARRRAPLAIKTAARRQNANQTISVSFPGCDSRNRARSRWRRRLCRVSCAAGAHACRRCAYRSRSRNPRLH